MFMSNLSIIDLHCQRHRIDEDEECSTLVPAELGIVLNKSTKVQVSVLGR